MNIDFEKIAEFVNQVEKDGYSFSMGKWKSIALQNESTEYKLWIRKRLQQLFNPFDKQTLRLAWWSYRVKVFEVIEAPKAFYTPTREQLKKAKSGLRGQQGWFNTLLTVTKT